MAIEDYYRSLIVQRVTLTPNGFGGYSESWSDNITIQGLINQASSKEILAAAQHQNFIDSKMYTAVDQDIKVDDRVVDDDGAVYRIVSVPKNTVRRDHHWKILLRRVDTDG